MAKARPVPELTPDQSYAEAAARILAVRGEELADHSAGVLDTSDIERVHDMRVATRRLRAALEVFEACFPAKPYRRTLREVKRIADGLGERRDRDVAVLALERFNQQMDAGDRPGVDSLVASLRDEQAQANEDLAPMVSQERVGELREAIAELIGAAREPGE
ncbi:MAG: CHAD domain-containing protein [Solirubrobacterales bacterium]|nr:CHAD domain-containing protein [Solirubrobacterales bacterium]